VALRDITDREAVLRAIAEADEIGERLFLEKYGFGESRRYRIVHKGKNYPSKAILAAAHGYQFPDREPLTNAEFSGGTQTTAKAEELGFEISVVTDELGGALTRFMSFSKRRLVNNSRANIPRTWLCETRHSELKAYCHPGSLVQA
jgi:hypothetical protein